MVKVFYGADRSALLEKIKTEILDIDSNRTIVAIETTSELNLEKSFTERNIIRITEELNVTENLKDRYNRVNIITQKLTESIGLFLYNNSNLSDSLSIVISEGKTLTKVWERLPKYMKMLDSIKFINCN